MKKAVLLMMTHVTVGAAGFAFGIYLLPILTEPEGPSVEEVAVVAAAARYTAEFRRDLTDSDALHWGEGQVAITDEAVSFAGRLAPGPDYKLYFSPEYLETEAEFNRLKTRMARAGDVMTFDGFVVQLPESLDPADYAAVIVWCETFGQFITAAAYR
jgi:hypothetical protein